jgi:hypothetical protein
METELYEEFYLYDWRKNYELLKRIKLAFDPNSVMNMGKIVNALKWMKISVLNRAEKNPKFKPFKIFQIGI